MAVLESQGDDMQGTLRQRKPVVLKAVAADGMLHCAPAKNRTLAKNLLISANDVLTGVFVLVGAILAILWSFFRALCRYCTNLHLAYTQPESMQRKKASTKVQYYVQRQGYVCDEHKVTTKDGHILTLFRVRKDLEVPSGTPILIQHGILQSSGVFVCNEENSLAFVLKRLGYDVWLGNNRGTYSKNAHVVYNANDPEFWDFTIDELARFDLPAMVDYVLLETNREKLVFIGHSQGTAQAFMSLSLTDEENSDLNSKIQVFIALAPALFIPPMRFPLNMLSLPSADNFYKLIGKGRFLPLIYLGRRILPRSVYAFIAFRTMNFVFGWDDENWILKNKPKYFSFTPVPTSCKLLRHWAIIGSSGQFRPYGEGNVDDGTEPYALENVSVPVALFMGDKDKLCIGSEAVRICEERKINVVFKKVVHGYDHACHIWARNSKDKVYRDVVKVIKNYDDHKPTGDVGGWDSGVE